MDSKKVEIVASDPEGIKYKIAFSMLRNINLGIAERIMNVCGDERRFFEMTESQLASLGRFPESIKSESVRNSVLEKAKREIDFIYSNNISPLFYDSDNFPTRLRNCSDGPIMLYQLGDTPLEARHVISIVGTRHATPYGLDATGRIVRELADRLDDLVIVSGLAYGIDVAAHRAALDCGVPTVAVTAHPLNTIYPADHRGTAVQMLRNGGSLVTEYSTSHDVHKTNFLARNRIIAGIADATIVVESDIQGGSLVTAGLAYEYDREVFAVPGRISDKYSQGTLGLIASNKANIYISAEQLIDIMGWEAKPTEGSQMELPVEMTPEEQSIHEYLTVHPASSVNELMIATGIPTGRLKDLLFHMEMNDIIMSIGGNRYSVI